MVVGLSAAAGAAVHRGLSFPGRRLSTWLFTRARGLPSLKARPAALPASELLEPPSAFPALLRVLPRPLAGCGDPFLLLPRLLPVRPRLPTATRSTDPLGATSGKPQKRSERARPARQAAALPRSQLTGDPDGPGSLQPSLSPLLGSSRCSGPAGSSLRGRGWVLPAALPTSACFSFSAHWFLSYVFPRVFTFIYLLSHVFPNASSYILWHGNYIYKHTY